MVRGSLGPVFGGGWALLDSKKRSGRAKKLLMSYLSAVVVVQFHRSGVMNETKGFGT